MIRKVRRGSMRNYSNHSYVRECARRRRQIGRDQIRIGHVKRNRKGARG